MLLIKESNKSSFCSLLINSILFKSFNLIKLSSALNSAFIKALNSKSLLLLKLISLNISFSSYKNKDKGFSLKKAEKGY
jgi:hypothetical protein